jgi:hypothetical protein
MQPSTSDTTSAGGQVRARPRMATVFGAAFLAGAVVAFGVNRVLEVHLTQARPQVECEPIFVALRSLPQGSAITVWDVALRDWPKAMLPSNALRAQDSFEGMVLRHPLREGQPLVTAQLAEAAPPAADRTAGAAGWPPSPAPAAESWTPARPAAGSADVSQAPAPGAVAAAEPVSPPTPPAEPTPSEPIAAAAPAAPPVTADPPPAADADTATLASSASVAEEPAASPPAAAADAVAAAPVSTDPPTAAPAADLAADAGAEPAVAEPALAAVEPTAPVAAAMPASIPTTTAVHGIADLPPVDAAVATVTDAVATLPSVATTAMPTLAEPWPAANPGATPLAPPVPMSPATDIEMPLASITSPRQRPAPRTASAQRTASAPPVAGPATPSPAVAPLRHLVVPERVAVQADASFVKPQADRGRGPLPQSSGRQAAAAPRQRPRGVPQAPRPTAPTTQGQRKPNAPAARQPIQGRTETAPAKPAGWLPKLGFGFGAGTSR